MSPRGYAASSTAPHSRTWLGRQLRDGSVPVLRKDERCWCCPGELCRGKGPVWGSPGAGGSCADEEEPVPVSKG